MYFCYNIIFDIAHVGPGGVIEEAVRKEMAKLDIMELKRNHIVLSEDGAASPDKDAAIAVKGQKDTDEEPVGGDGNDKGKGNEKEVVSLRLNGGGVESNELAGGGHNKEEEMVVGGADADGVKTGGDVHLANGKLV